MKAKLNNSKINQLKTEAATKGSPVEGRDTRLHGLAIVVHPSGKGVWRIDYKHPITLRRRRKRIGDFPALTIVQARQIASEKFQKIALGLDPFAVDEPDETTVEKAWNRYLNDYLVHRSEKYQYDARGYGRREVIPNFGSKLIAEVSRAELLAYVDGRRAETRAAGDTLYRHIHAFLGWCVDAGLIETNPIVKKRVNGRGRGQGADRGRTNRRARSLVSRERGDEELGRCIAAATLARDLGEHLPVELRPSSVYCDATVMLLASGKRLEEVFEAPMGEFDLESGIWVIPAERRKGIRSDTPPEKRKPEVVPLFDLAREVLGRRARDHFSEFVFSVDGARPYSTFDRNKKKLLALAGIADVVHHDYRRTVITKLGGWKFGAEVRHAVLGHVGALDGDELDLVYNLHSYAEEKAEALEKWDRYLISLRSEWVAVLAAELVEKGLQLPRDIDMRCDMHSLH